MDVDNLAQTREGNSFPECHRCGMIIQVDGSSGSSLFCDDCAKLKPRLGLSHMSSAVFLTVASLTVIFFILLLDNRSNSDSRLSLSRFSLEVDSGQQYENLNIVVSSKPAEEQGPAAPVVTQLVTPVPSQPVTEQNQTNSVTEPTATDIVSATSTSESLDDISSASVASSQPDYQKYLVVAGDSLYAIAEQFLTTGLTLDEYTQLIREANYIGNSDDLSIGMELLIPQIKDVSE